MVYRIVIAIAAVALVVLLFAGNDDLPVPLPLEQPSWVVRAQTAWVAGGYGDNFAYSGKNVRALQGTLELHYDPAEASGTIVVDVETTQASGPLRIGAGQSLEGHIRLTSTLSASDQILEDTPVFGSTGHGGSAFPVTHATLAGQSRFALSAGGRPVASDLAGEWALADALRRSDGSIRQSGLVYSPLLRDKSGFSNPKETQFLLVVHSDTADPDNAPPYAIALDLFFTHVMIEERPPQTASRTPGA